MLQFFDFFQHLAEHDRLRDWAADLPQQIQTKLADSKHGHLDDWYRLLEALPLIPERQVDLNHASVTATGLMNSAAQNQLREQLLKLHPWRKGPFHMHGIDIDAEWRSDQKWARVAPHIDLQGRTVLDVGCGNGYYAYRMLGDGARWVLGIDPTLTHVMQFQALQHCIGQQPLAVVPLGIEDIPPRLAAFDVVFSMGVLYHRRSPFDHLLELRDCLSPQGTLVLETLVIEGGEGQVLVPPGRYAKMRNVWFLPSPDTLISWLKRCGFKTARCVDLSYTSQAEQRRTDWMQFESLSDFLDPDDPKRTVEGLPAPYRAVFVAQR